MNYCLLELLIHLKKEKLMLQKIILNKFNFLLFKKEFFFFIEFFLISKKKNKFCQIFLFIYENIFSGEKSQN